MGTGRTPTARQAQIWEVARRHGSQTAAARELGISHGAVRTALVGYMAATGTTGPMPGQPRKGGRPYGITRARVIELETRVREQAVTIARLREGAKRGANPTPGEDWQPACMDPDDLAEWQAFNRSTTGTMRAQRPCDDCPMSFALEMFAARRCNGVPGQD